MNQRPTLIALVIFSLGVIVRCIHLFMLDVVHEPFRLGGLFIAFANQIARRNFVLPSTIPHYSVNGIPFAYPPLGFYVEAVLLRLFPNQAFTIANLLPVFITVIALGFAAAFFYRWAEGWNLRSISALATYALLPNAFFNQIEAAGLAEAFGSLAILVYFALLLEHQKQNTWKSAVWTGLGLALCVISSPGSALGAPAISIIFALDVLISSRCAQISKPSLQLLVIAFVSVLGSAPFWVTVMQNHGADIFLMPLKMQYAAGDASTLTDKLYDAWFTYGVLQLSGALIWNSALLAGIGWLIRQRKYFQPLAFAALFSIPRENAWLTAFPAALLIAYGVTEVLVPVVRSFSGIATRVKVLVLNSSAALILFFVSALALKLAILQAQNENWKVAPASVDAILQAREVIPASAQVIVLSNPGLREWAPYLLQREVINTEFGLEWQPAEYQIVMRANRIIETARDWHTIKEAVQLLTDNDQVYVVIGSGVSWGDNNSGGAPVSVQINSPELQVILLELP